MPFNPGVNPGKWTDETDKLTFGREETAPGRYLLICTIHLHAKNAKEAKVTFHINGNEVAHGSIANKTGPRVDTPDAIQDEVFTAILRRGESFWFENQADPAGENNIDQVMARKL